MSRPRDLSLYTLQSTDTGYIITKYDSIGLEILSQYEMMAIDDTISCPCPQGHKPSCRHRKMLPMMVERADKPWFFCYDTGEWKPQVSAMADPDLLEAVGQGDGNGNAKPYEEPQGPTGVIETVLEAPTSTLAKPMRRL